MDASDEDIQPILPQPNRSGQEDTVTIQTKHPDCSET